MGKYTRREYIDHSTLEPRTWKVEKSNGPNEVEGVCHNSNRMRGLHNSKITFITAEFRMN
jgi:hypothetical protein